MILSTRQRCPQGRVTLPCPSPCPEQGRVEIFFLPCPAQGRVRQVRMQGRAGEVFIPCKF